MDWIFVIVRAISLYTTFYIVSIHLMLLFIGVIFNSCRWCMCFNTSHVTLYPVPEMIYLPRDSFNTSYVTLYLQNKTHLEHQSFSFNTSHITLYRRNWKRRKKVTAVSIHLMLLFIRNVRWNSRKWFGFNTSHVTLYQYKACKLHIRPERFNTSHVTLYQIRI